MSKIIDFNEFRKRKDTKKEISSIPGFIVWLRCPTCQSTEYTEVRMQGGRIHNCGTLVEEVEVQIDIRAEYTISMRNIDLLENGSKQASSSRFKETLRKKLMGAASRLITQIKNNEIEYQRRLELIHDKSINCYPDEWDPLENGIELTTVEPTGIMITVARQADKYFPQKK